MDTKILVVDDDSEFREILREGLSLHGFQITEAQNEGEFREKAFEWKPDLIILDIMLGDQNGVIVYENLLAEGFEKKIPVIFLSALAKDRPPSPASGERIYALHSKSIRIDHLVKEIGRILKK